MKYNFPRLDQITEANFEQNALDLFDYQFHEVEVYRKYCHYLGVDRPKTLSEIPFLPIQFFKTHKVLASNLSIQKIFKSSGTTENHRSQHYIHDINLYEYSFLNGFSQQMTNPEECIVIAVLPNYQEQGDSSLVYMVDSLIKCSGHKLSGFYLNELKAVSDIVQKARLTGRDIVLFGVSFALLDLAEQNIDLSGVKIIETGGMKGRRKEIIRSELHSIFRNGLNVESVYSEYGMTELLSQAYTDGSEYFKTPPWMSVLIRDINDPLSYRNDGKTGGVNVIDLANRYSCSFIATDDLGVIHNESFKILGRFDQSDIRGCNLLVN